MTHLLLHRLTLVYKVPCVLDVCRQMLALYARREPHVDNARTKSPPRRSKSPPRSSSTSTLVSTMSLGFVTHRRSIVEGGGCFQRRLFVCPFVNTITSE